MTQDELIREAVAEIVNNIDRWRQEYGEQAGEYPTVEGYDEHIGNHVRDVVSMLAYRSHDIGWYAALQHTHDLAKDVESEIAAGCYDPDYERGFYRCFEKIEEVINEGKEGE